MAESLRAADEGADLWPQVAGRATGLLSGHFTTYSLFDIIPAYQRAKRDHSRATDLVAALRTPEVRRAVLEWQPASPGEAERMEKAYRSTYVLGTPPDYEPGPDRSLAAIATATGRTPLEVA